MDFKSGSGANIWAWNDAKMQYMIQNDRVFLYTGTGDDFSWKDIGGARMTKTSSFVEIRVPLGILNLASPRELKVGFGRNFEDFAPIPGRRAAVVNTLAKGALRVQQEELAKEKLLDFYKNFGVSSASFEWDKTVRTEPAPNYIVYMTPHMEWEVSGENMGCQLKLRRVRQN